MGSMPVVAALATLAWSTRSRWPIVTFGGDFVEIVGRSWRCLGVRRPSGVLTAWRDSLAWVGGVGLSRSSQALRARFHIRRVAAQVRESSGPVPR